MRLKPFLFGVPLALVLWWLLWLAFCSNSDAQQSSTKICWQEGAYRMCRETETTPTPLRAPPGLPRRTETITKCWQQGAEERCEKTTTQR